MKKLTHKLAAHAVIFTLTFSLFSCGTRKTPPPAKKAESSQSPTKIVADENLKEQLQATPAEPLPDANKRKEQITPKKNKSGKVRSCSTRVNAGAIANGTVSIASAVGAVALAASSAFAGPLLFIPAIIAGANSTAHAKSKKLMRAAMKIVHENSNDNVLVGYAGDFLDKKKKVPTRDEMRAFNDAKEDVEKAIRKHLKASRKMKVTIPNVEFAETVFIHDLRGDLCEGGIHTYNETVSILEDLVVSKNLVIKQGGCNTGCCTTSCP